ncbi:MAG: LptF/LptG family permease, partial [Candidatus Auribacterota bacterium]|nr:LptF/LptG family permease [Candidatus Auribacterota bacterium]
MKIITTYIGKSIVGTFLITLLVLVGILCLGNLLKVADFILKGMDPLLIIKFFGFLIIKLLQYAIPMSILTATILVFGRLSADNEITGMRASGIGIFPIVVPVFFISFGLMLFSFYLQNTAIPKYSFAIRRLKANIGLQAPDLLLQPGEIIDFPGYTINFDKKEDGVLYKIQINQYDDDDDLASSIFAKSASIEFDKDREGFILRLHDGTVEEITDRDNPQFITTTSFGQFSYPISLKELYESTRITEDDRRKKDMVRSQLLMNREKLLQADEISEEDYGEISNYTTEIHKRLSLAVACFSLVFISIPMAIKTHRGEKSIGMALSLALIFFYYIFIAYADAIAADYLLYPYLIVWAPNLL